MGFGKKLTAIIHSQNISPLLIGENHTHNLP